MPPVSEATSQDGADFAKARSEALDELRGLLLAPEQSRLEQLQERLDNPVLHAHDVSLVLPDAIALRRQSDRSLTQALTPVVEEALTDSVKKAPHVIVDVIVPIMGPAIRQSIVQALQGMVQSLNQTLEQSMSVKGLRWRIESWKTGRPFAEVVLLHTLLYRVEQVFLIHRETGLLLHHVSAVSAVQDTQLVSGMLTAIQQFVRDSFGAGEEEMLDHFQVGDHTVWIEQGPRAFLAGVIRGTPPVTLRHAFREALEQVHARHRNALARFDGNPAPFESAHTTLESCLQSQATVSGRTKPSSAVWVLGAVLLLGVAIWGWLGYQAHQRWDDFLSRARAEPGLVITAADSTFAGYRVEGLRDPLSRDPGLLLEAAGIDPAEVTASWVPYYALDSRLIVKRVQSVLHPPSTVTLSMTGDALEVSGSAPVEWAREAKRLALLVPGVAEFQDRALKIVSLEQLVGQINHTVFHFAAGSSAIEPADQERLSSLIAVLRELDQAAAQSSQRVTIRVLGSADESGPDALNLRLSQDRAQVVFAALGGERFGSATHLTAGIGNPAATEDRAVRRSFEKRIAFLRASLGPAELPSTGRP
jgi:OOP family OmpA-OmpF porin